MSTAAATDFSAPRRQVVMGRQILTMVIRPPHNAMRSSGSDVSTVAGAGGGGGRADHRVDRAAVTVQTGLAQQRGGPAGQELGDGFDDEPGQRPLEGGTPDPWVDHLDEGRRTGDHPHVVGAGKCQPAGDVTVPLHGLGEPFTVQDQGAARHSGRRGVAVDH